MRLNEGILIFGGEGEKQTWVVWRSRIILLLVISGSLSSSNVTTNFQRVFTDGTLQLIVEQGQYGQINNFTKKLGQSRLA